MDCLKLSSGRLGSTKALLLPPYVQPRLGHPGGREDVEGPGCQKVFFGGFSSFFVGCSSFFGGLSTFFCWVFIVFCWVFIVFLVSFPRFFVGFSLEKNIPLNSHGEMDEHLVDFSLNTPKHPAVFQATCHLGDIPEMMDMEPWGP